MPASSGMTFRGPIGIARKIPAMSHDAPMNLTHHFLIAMPGLQDASFARSVVYLCEHSSKGALGLVINKPTDINLKNLFDKVDLPLGRQDLASTPVLQGGPVQTERGFVLHEAVHAEGADASESVYASTMTIPGGLEMTTSKDVLEAISTGAGPRKLLVTLGYSAWGEGSWNPSWPRTAGSRSAPIPA
jgi:putative transcriptional regulator